MGQYLSVGTRIFDTDDPTYPQIPISYDSADDLRWSPKR